VRDLDPVRIYDAVALWCALRICLLHDVVERARLALAASVDERQRDTQPKHVSEPEHIIVSVSLKQSVSVRDA
jgi:hypothetical protein